MDAGRELDLLIADKVFGLVLKDTFTGKETSITSGIALQYSSMMSTIPRFSTDIKDAWLVVEKISDDNFCIEQHGTHWKAHFGSTWRGAETAPHAICLAALEALNLTHPSSV